MKGFIDDIEHLTEDNSDFRRVLYTGKHLQLVLMTLEPGEEIGEEVHKGADQFFRVEKGRGEVWIDGKRTKIKSDDAFLVPSGAVGTQVMTTTPAITTTTANCLLIAGLSPDTTIDRPVISSWPQGFDENQVSVVNPGNPYPLGWANIFSAERHLQTAGTVPASSFNWTVTDGGQYYGALSFVLALSP